MIPLGECKPARMVYHCEDHMEHMQHLVRQLTNTQGHQEMDYAFEEH